MLLYVIVCYCMIMSNLRVRPADRLSASSLAISKRMMTLIPLPGSGGGGAGRGSGAKRDFFFLSSLPSFRFV